MTPRQEHRGWQAIDAYIANSCVIKQAAHSLGITERTFWNWTYPLRHETRLTHVELAIRRARSEAA